MELHGLAANIKELREVHLKMSQPQFAELMQVRENTVSRWETARITPEVDRLWQMADKASEITGEYWTIDHLVGRLLD